MSDFHYIYATDTSTWWDPNGPLKLLHVTKDLVAPYFVEVISKSLSEKKKEDIQLLDVGCGGGLCSEIFAAEGYSVTGIDVNPDVIQVAKTHSVLNQALTNLYYYAESVETHSENNLKKYDVVVVSFVLQHLTHHEEFLNKCIKCLKPGGIILIGTLGKNIWSWIMRKLYTEWLIRLAPSGIYNYDRCINVDVVEGLLGKNDCQTKQARGFVYNPFYGKFSWFPLTLGYYVLHAVKNH